MIPISLAEVAQDTNGRIPEPSSPCAQELICAVTSDSRTVTGGELFVAIAGERVNGNDLGANALAAGARAVLTADEQRARNAGVPPERMIVVDDPIAALGRLARENLVRARIANPNMRVVAITGSVGKTTTKDLLALLLAGRGPIVAPPGSFNNELGLPLTVLQVGADTATVVLEMGADHIGNIDYLTSIAPPDIAVVLIVARAHLGEFGGIENVARAKSELVTGTRPQGTVILNRDDERVRQMADMAHTPVVFFGAEGDVYATDIQITDRGCAQFQLHTPRGCAPVRLGLVGEHHVTNACAAAAVGHVCQMTPGQIAEILTDCQPGSPHRMAVSEGDGITIIDDSYNANPDSMRAGIAALAMLGAGRRTVAILGQMLELGEESEAEHAALGRVLHEKGIDVLVTVGSGMEACEKAARRVGIEVYHVQVNTATQQLHQILRPHDVVLLKGSNGSGVWRIADALVRKAS
ncbi:UDP-N-acetylmuramoyl-tripeptide--D-alanyl-D-alanine ligase [Trueperella sp. LYQ143]|uniref:UDP-N-acetylmuramoyl-tripeptide--D-alanyl-D- alanine ligase n=1 Tax=unclassified Trueperella TaxID=2630174 RepID=UPI003983CFA0